MADAGCGADGREHTWGEWLAYDKYPFEMGMTDGFRYRRECLMSGCSAKQRVENLVPSGKTEIDNG